MNERLSIASLIWGVVITLAGAALTAAGLGWWDPSVLDFRWVWPILVILIGVGVVVGALNRNPD